MAKIKVLFKAIFESDQYDMTPEEMVQLFMSPEPSDLKESVDMMLELYEDCNSNPYTIEGVDIVEVEVLDVQGVVIGVQP